VFQFGVLSFVWGGLSPPVATGLSGLWTKVEQAADHRYFFLTSIYE